MLKLNKVFVLIVKKKNQPKTQLLQQVQKQMQTLHQLWLDKNHKLLHPDTKEAKDFVNKVDREQQLLAKQFPWLNG